MRQVQMRTFRSVADFLRRFVLLFAGPSFITTLLGVDAKFREKLLLTVTMANNCAS